MESSDYAKQRKKLLEDLRKVAKKSGTDIASRLVKGRERSENNVCEMARMVFREALDSYEDGEMEWKEMVDDLSKTLLAIEA